MNPEGPPQPIPQEAEIEKQPSETVPGISSEAKPAHRNEAEPKSLMETVEPYSFM